MRHHHEPASSRGTAVATMRRLRRSERVQAANRGADRRRAKHLAVVLTIIVVAGCSTTILGVGHPMSEPVRASSSGPSTFSFEPASRQTSTSPIEPESAVMIVGASAADNMLVADALAAFSAAGLEVPALEIRFAATEADCRGHLGLFEQRAIRSRIHICEAKDFVVTHEIAHVWAAVNLDREQREHYMRVRGLDNWNDWDAPWRERGIEDAAFVMQQNLTMDRVPLSSATWVGRIEAFEILTGQPSPLRARSSDSLVASDAPSLGPAS